MFTKLKTSVSTLAELKAKHDVAFSVLHPQVEVVKRSPVVHLAMGATTLGLVFTGHFGPAAGLLGCWIGSRPLTHVLAGGLACIGQVDAILLKATAQIQHAATDAQAGEQPGRRQRQRAQPQAVPAPAAG